MSAFTLRLDERRHLKLRLAAAVSGKSAQKMCTEALDDYLTRFKGLDDLAAKARGDAK